MLFLFLAATGLSIFDSYISHKRIKKFGPLAEVNLALRQVAEDFGVASSVAVGLIYNLLVLAILCYFNLSLWLAFWVGAKFGLALMQLKSLQMETYVERVLFKFQQKRQQQR